MKLIITIIFFFVLSDFSRAQNIDSIYTFMNRDLPENNFGKSDWGMFFLENPYIINNRICVKILEAFWDKSDFNLRDEFYKNCRELSSIWQTKFKWSQENFHKKIIVADTKHRIAISTVSKLPMTNSKKNQALYWIKKWNKSKAENRLVNYSSIPIFSKDKNYVLIVKGQDVESEGGWDSIYIYKREEKNWTVWKEIVVTTI